jgi:Rrf2 family transcriptional regulator, cysteine metabolism repressor
MSIRLSTKGRYGVRAMIELAEKFGQGPVLVRSIAEHQEISTKYLHALLAALKAAKLVRSVRGSGGGYALVRPPAEIRLDEILQALEGPLSIVDCVLDSSVCDRACHCAARDTWAEVSHAIESTLAGITLEDLLSRQQLKDATSPR